MAVAAGETKQAVAIVSDWLRKNPGDFQIRKERASLLLATGEQEAARRDFEMLLKQRPDDPVVLNNLAWIVQKTDPARGLSLITLAAKIAPRSADIVDTFGWIKFQQQDAQGALPLLQRAHELDAGNPEIGYHLAVALDGTGKRADAKVLLKSILAKNTKFEDAHNAEQLIAHW
jgi:Flp pilus assembly protein TadD